MEENEERLLLVNKPLEWTSFDVVNKLRSILRIKKIGHAGTLDPLATGLLILCTGKMTKKIDSYQGLEKEYTGTLVLGQTTPSYDLETEPSPPADISGTTEQAVRDATRSFLGSIQQVPPAHSSIKIGGKRAYSLARAGQHVELKARTVDIREFEITGWASPEVRFRVVCSKGTYIRSLAHDLGKKLGVGAYLSQLCRTRIGTYHLSQAATLEEIAAAESLPKKNTE
ncbi:MAG: tRNA pseudouridine(55) synthase TruB [Cytophagales bacterium]|nr:tRNA pseudouridine(55) synthase TruB [Cytophagales bacterium]